MPHSGERAQCLGGDRVEELAWVSKTLGQAPADLEMQLGHVSARHLAVHGRDLGLQALAVYERARVELGQAVRME